MGCLTVIIFGSDKTLLKSYRVIAFSNPIVGSLPYISFTAITSSPKPHTLCCKFDPSISCLHPLHPHAQFCMQLLPPAEPAYSLLQYLACTLMTYHSQAVFSVQ